MKYIRNCLLTATTVAGLAIGGCATTATTIPATIDTVEQDIQNAASHACQFVPTIATVASIIATLFPGGSATEAIVGTVASQICSAVAASPAAASARLGATASPVPVYYPGTTVEIHGTFESKSASRLRRGHR